MSIEIIPINGKTDFFDYEDFEESAKATIGRRCSDAKIFLFNNFPASVSVETNIDLILIIAIEDKKGNFYIPKSVEKQPVYFHNQIIPIRVVNQFKDSKLSKDDKGQLVADKEFIDYSSEINSMRYSLINYLSNRCGFEKQNLYVHPLIWIKNKSEIFHDHYLTSEVFDFKALTNYFKGNSNDIFISYKAWKTSFGYQNINEDIERITDQASRDSEIGYLTKKKVDRIGKQLSSSKKIFKELNQNLVIVNGKAGTGKSSELLLLAMKCISNGKNTLYLTYNKLLIFDIAKTVKSYVNSKLYDKSGDKPGGSTVLTLHGFFFRLSKSLGVLHVLNADRIQKLLDVLKIRMRKVHDLVFHETRANSFDFEKIKSTIQNHSEFDVGTKEVGIDFINFLKSKRYKNNSDFNKVSLKFFNHKKSIVSNIEANEVFLADYYGVLEDTLLQIESPEKFYDKYNVEDKHELLDVAIGLSKKYEGEKDGKKTITEKGFIEFKNRRVGGHRRKRTLFIDEAQDCHRLEKEILISIYGSNNIVVANGGKEQLIRHVELCNWEVSNAQKLSVKKHYTRNKSYRVKKTVVSFCNYVAKRFGIDLNLEPLESEDEGELLIDFRQSHDSHKVSNIVNVLNTKGEVNGCTPYETLMVLIESNSQRKGLSEQKNQNRKSAIINEYGNFEEAQHLKRGTWKHIDSIENDNIMFWDGTVADKSQLIVPGPYESRVLYYESCRGLEAWSVACFAIDKFFNQKRKDPDAEKFLIEDLFLNQNNEQRKSMYAATWVLMALTRVIDTLYIQINDKNSEFGKVVVDYMNLKNKNVRELK